MTGSEPLIEHVATAVASVAVAEADSGVTSEDLIGFNWPFLKRHELENRRGRGSPGAAMQQSLVDVGGESRSARHRALATLEEAARARGRRGDAVGIADRLAKAADPVVSENPGVAVLCRECSARLATTARHGNHGSSTVEGFSHRGS